MNRTTVFLIIIICIGTILRFTNLNWDSYQAFHPDERNIAWAVTRIRWFDQLNPKFFAYGGLPIYLYKLLSDLTAFVTGDPTWTTEWGKIAVTGRAVSATLSSVSILFIYFVTTRYFSKVTGLFAAFFLAFSPWAIREAHFATTETMLVFFLLVLLLRPRHLLSGIVWGLAMAAKPTSLLFGLILLPICARTLLAAAGTFLLFSPYTVIDWQQFRQSMDYETGVALGRFSVPYTLQFTGTLPYLYQLQTMLWQAGAVPILGIAGLLLLLRKPNKRLPLLLFPLLYFAWSGSWYAKFARYTVPLLPFLTLSAAWLPMFLFQKFSQKKFHLYICIFVYLLIGTAHALWGLANWTIYLRPDTRIAATRWVTENVPIEAKLLTEHWNDGLPVPHSRKLLNVYDEDTDVKMATLASQLKEADYLILTTRRIWGTMPRLTKRYPQTSRWYQHLLSGELGYTQVATFTSYPLLFGVDVNDDAAEESIQVFDHPTVRIFKHAASP